MKKIVNDLDQILNRKNKKIVLCHGVFDLIHQGHLLHFQKAKSLGDILIISVTDDNFVNKGPGRPYFSASNRLAVLSNLKIVDYVFLSKNPTALESLKIFRPNFYVKGQEYKNHKNDLSGNIIKETKYAKKINCKIIYTEEDVYSSTKILNKQFNIHGQEIHDVIKNLKKKYTLAKVIEIIKNIKSFKTLILGDALFDLFNFVKVLGSASKYPVLSTEFLYQEKHLGGTLAITKILEQFDAKLKLILVNKSDSADKDFIKKRFNKNTQLIFLNLINAKILEKIRFVSFYKKQNLFQMSSSCIKNNEEILKKFNYKNFNIKLKSIIKSNNENLILLDFGLSIFNESRIIKELENSYKNLFINVQSNSNNYGFNLFTKYKRYKYLSLTKREFELGINKKFDNNYELKKNMLRVFKKNSFISITLGAEGSLFLDKKRNIYYMPAFFKELKDTTGCGDAYFAITSSLISMGYSDEIVPFLGNCYAGLHGQNSGNKIFPLKVDLIKTVSALFS